MLTSIPSIKHGTGLVNLFRLLAVGALSLVGLVAALPVLLLSIPFVSVSRVAQLVGTVIRPGSSTTPEEGAAMDLVQFEPMVGWKPKPHLDGHARAGDLGDPYRLTTDANGWRGRWSVSESEIVVFGDSFAFGHGTDDESYFANRNNDLRIKAIGSNGYNMVQALLWMERMAEELEGKLVVWFVYYGNDLFENLQPNLTRYRMPFARSLDGMGQWEIVTSHVSPDPWPIPTAWAYQTKLAEICSATELSRRVWDACEFLIERGRDICRKAGAELVVLGIPHKWQLSSRGRHRLAQRSPEQDGFDAALPDRRLRAICSEFGVGFVALSDHLTHADYKDDDCHWNPRGDRRVAQLLCELAPTSGKRQRRKVSAVLRPVS